MALEPPPSVARADRLRTEGIGRGLRTGAKTATKDQERDYLDRFRRLAADPSPLIPRWRGDGADPFVRVRAQLGRVQARQKSGFWLKWYARGRKLRSAYAHTLLVLEAGRIPSFASIKFRGRDVKFVLRGNGLRDKLAAIQNFEEPDVRLLAYVDWIRSHRAVLVSLPGEFFAVPMRGPIPTTALQAIFRDASLDVQPIEGGVACPHAEARRAVLRTTFSPLGASVALCRACLKRLRQGLVSQVEAFVLAPGGHLKPTRSVAGSEWTVHPESARPELEGLLAQASAAAVERSKKFEGVRDEDFLDWTEEELFKLLGARPDGHLLVDRDLWLAQYEEAAQRFGADELERRAVEIALRLRTPRWRVSDPGINRLLEPVWPDIARPLLGELAGRLVEAAELEPLLAQRPSDALASLSRMLRTEERFANYPRYGGLPAPLRLAHDLFKAHRTGDAALFQRRLGDGVRDPELKPLALALARAFGQSAGIEWQYAPHEKDQARYFEPLVKPLSVAQPETYESEVVRLAGALGFPAPARRAPTEAPQSRPEGREG